MQTLAAAVDDHGERGILGEMLVERGAQICDRHTTCRQRTQEWSVQSSLARIVRLLEVELHDEELSRTGVGQSVGGFPSIGLPTPCEVRHRRWDDELTRMQRAPPIFPRPRRKSAG